MQQLQEVPKTSLQDHDIIRWRRKPKHGQGEYNELGIQALDRFIDIRVDEFLMVHIHVQTKVGENSAAIMTVSTSAMWNLHRKSLSVANPC